MSDNWRHIRASSRRRLCVIAYRMAQSGVSSDSPVQAEQILKESGDAG